MNSTTQAFPLVLLEPAIAGSDQAEKNIYLCGEKWVLSEYLRPSDAPPYTCISYAWGTGTAASPFVENQSISDRTISVLETTIRVLQDAHGLRKVISSYRGASKIEGELAECINASRAFWIDALCVPPPTNMDARVACLSSMGQIYSSAAQVLTVLSNSCGDVLKEISANNSLDPSLMFVLERDEWVTRGWAYQEIVNSQVMFFAAEGPENVIVSGIGFLNAILTATSDYKDKNEIDAFSWSEAHPRLEALEELLADYKTAEYSERSALQVMSSIHRRVVQRPEDYFYAMIGALTTSSRSTDVSSTISPSEYFMRVCEGKNDYSFMFNTAPRSEVAGRRWRPIEGQFAPILVGLLATGEGLSGSLEATHIHLKKMCKALPSQVSQRGLDSIKSFVHLGSDNHQSVGELAVKTLDILRKKGFSGCGEFIELGNGIFFPQHSVSRKDGIFVATPVDLKWVNACPGILLLVNGTDINEYYDVGVFVGRVAETGEFLNIA